MPNKNALAILSGIAAVGLTAFAVYLGGDPLAVLGATAAAIGFCVWGVAPGHRGALVMIVIAAGSAALFLHFDSFWGLFVALLVLVWSAVGLLPVMDAVWRFKVGFVVAVFLGAIVALWPSADGLLPTPETALPEQPAWLNSLARVGRSVGSKLHCPRYIKDRVTFAIAPGLDLSGGLRLVYTVEVEEAIRDKRDHFADEMRQELATIFALHSGDGRVTRDELAKLDDKVHVAQPEAAIIRLKFKDKADKAKIDDRFTKKFLGELAETPGPGDDEVTFKIRGEVESQIRERAVAQAKDTILRRVDELGLREAAVTTRDEDIIVEVPGSNEQSFRDIKDIIRKTARLEFKMVDDTGSEKVFGPPALKSDDLPEGEGIAQYQEIAPDGLDAAGKKRSAKTFYTRMSCQPPKYATESLTDCLGALQCVDEDPQRSRRSRHRLRGRHRAGRGHRAAAVQAGGLAFALPLRPRRADGRLHHRREPRAGPAELRAVLRAAVVLARRSRSLRGGHRRERQPALRDHPRRPGRLGAGHPTEDRRRQGDHHDGRRRPGEAAPRRQAARARAPLRRAAGPDHAELRVDHRAVARARLHPARRARARSSAPSRCSSSCSSTTGSRAIVADVAVLFNLMLQLAVLASPGRDDDAARASRASRSPSA